MGDRTGYEITMRLPSIGKCWVTAAVACFNHNNLCVKQFEERREINLLVRSQSPPLFRTRNWREKISRLRLVCVCVCVSVCAWKSRNRTRMKLAHNYQRNIVLESSPFKNRMTMGWMRVLPSWRCILDPGWNTHPAVVVFILLTRQRVWLRDLLHPTHRCFRDLYSLKKNSFHLTMYSISSASGEKSRKRGGMDELKRKKD